MRYNAKGTLLKLGDGAAPEVFTTIGQIMDIQGPNESRGTIDASDHDTVAAKEFLSEALYDGGEQTFELHWDPALATQLTMASLLRSGALRNYQSAFPTNPVRVLSYAAYVTGFSRGAPHDGKLTGSVTLKISGGVGEA